MSDEVEPRRAPTAAEIAAANEKAMLDSATNDLHRLVHSRDHINLVYDSYRPIVVVGRRFNAGTGPIDIVQSEIDRVFGPGKIAAADITTPPTP